MLRSHEISLSAISAIFGSSPSKAGNGGVENEHVGMEKLHVHPIREHPGYAVPSVLRSVCAFPERTELLPAVEHLRRLGLRRVTSIGCGEGFVEGLLEMEGLDVTCVDVDIFPGNHALYESFQMYTKTGEVVRLGNSAVIHEVDQPAQTALLFCFGKRLPWMTYLRKFGSALPLVFIIGDECMDERSVTQPTAHALSSWPGWELIFDGPFRAVLPARLVIYERR